MKHSVITTKSTATAGIVLVVVAAFLSGCGGGAEPVTTPAELSAGNAASATQAAAPVSVAVMVTSTSPTPAATPDPIAPTAPANPSPAAVVQPPSAVIATPPAPVQIAVAPTTTGVAVTNSVTPPVIAIVSGLTIPEYKTLRQLTGAVATDPLPNAAALVTMAAANRRMAVTQLAADLARSGNPAVVPPLTYAAFRTLTAASRGDTLAQLQNSGFDTAPVQYAAALQTNRVTSQLWSDRGRRFTPEFLTATDTTGPWPRLAGWSASESSFSDGRFASDAALISALAQVDPNLNPGALPGLTNNVRLVTANSVTEKASWAAVTPSDGIFDGGKNKHDLLQMPMVKVTAGVKRFAGIDFTADVLPMAGGLQLLSLRPNATASAASLATYSSTRLEAALSEAIQGLLTVGAKPVAGEMVLPKVEISLEIDPKGPLSRAGISLPFDEVNANFRSMDGLGGVYAQPFFSSASLRVGNDGLTVRAADATAFTFSAQNVFGPIASVGTIATLPLFTTFNLFTCAWPEPDLRSFFVVVLDTHGSVISLAAIQAPPGTQVPPARTAYNPWSANLAYWVFSGDMTGQYPLVISAVAGQPAGVDVTGQAASFGFVGNSGEYSHQTCVR